VNVELPGLPRQVTVAAGGRHEIPLPSFSGSGNSWSARAVSGADAATVTVRISPPPPPAAVPGTGPPEPRHAAERAVISGIRAGHARWRLELARSFGPRHPTAVVDIDIEVTNG